MSKSNRSALKLETDLLSLRALVAVVEEGGFTAAERRVGRTQSAISLQIAKLEERLGGKLLERTSRSVSITPAGETFVSYARRILELADEAVLAVTAPDENALLQEICRIVVDVGGYRLAWIGYAESDEEKSVRPVAQNWRCQSCLPVAGSQGIAYSG